MQIVRAADCRRMPWKNGGGETTEIATFPDGAGLDHFTWRLSAARVARDGPFSLFPGIDRTLAVLSGEGLDLRVGGVTTRIGPGDAPLSFPGDAPTEGRLVGGTVEDLNVMTRRELARHRMSRIAVAGSMSVITETGTAIVFCAEGEVGVGHATLRPRDAAVLGGPTPVRFDVDGQGTIYLIDIEVLPQPL